jgi:hypothetical protein
MGRHLRNNNSTVEVYKKQRDLISGLIATSFYTTCCIIFHLLVFTGLHSMHLGLPERTMTSAMSSDNVLKMIPRSDAEDHNVFSPGSTPDGPVKFSIDGYM